ncbi:hypothetical protein [Aliicoccus persicus]|uniref:Uncharacterized protein n=1 Tax=Aliicoccus persicus TaxID=930138 RepID=A0A662Z512_9STAP|nr:hypothetical protein [Aliicoccus persicus]SEW15116.1 hypothetical protein SAMN05192557_1848 [Aliicoccus persicus]
MSQFYLRDSYSPIDIYHNNEPRFFKNTAPGKQIATWDFNESLDYKDEPDEPVGAPTGENIIETDHVYLEVLDYELDGDYLFVTYNVTPKTLYNSYGFVNYQYIRVSQREGFGFGYTSVLIKSYDDENEDGERYLDDNTEYLEVGETVEETKVMEIIDEDKPFTIAIQKLAPMKCIMKNSWHLKIDCNLNHESISRDLI